MRRAGVSSLTIGTTRPTLPALDGRLPPHVASLPGDRTPRFLPIVMLGLQTEDRAKDTITFRLGAKRRYVMTALLGSIGLAAAVVGVMPASVGTVLGIAG